MVRRAVAVLAAAIGVVAAPASAAHLRPYVEDAESAMQMLRTEMMDHMARAMADGPGAAIDVCRHLAPEIARRISDETGWEIRRVSLRPRNPANAPDDREHAILDAYEARAAAGQSPAAMRTAMMVEDEAGARVHVMQAIPMLEPCKVCHGTDIDPEVATRIAEAYPDDQAVGYEVGDIRGAFSLSRPYEAGFGLPPTAWERIAALHFDEIDPGSLPGDPEAGRDAFRRACKSCHDPAKLAGHALAAKGAEAAPGFCRTLETHGAAPANLRCDIAAFLIAVSELLGQPRK